MATFTVEGRKVLAVEVPALHPDKTVVKIAAVRITSDDLSEIRDVRVGNDPAMASPSGEFIIPPKGSGKPGGEMLPAPAHPPAHRLGIRLEPVH